MKRTVSFEDLMSMAENNALKGEKKIKTSTAPQYNLTAKPKKESSKDRKLSEGVKKFLQKQEEEERRKAKEEKLKKERLMQLRYQDKKAHRRVNSMLKMTKSANKACMADAKTCLNDSLAEQGEFQPDEDDYGYESQHSQFMYQKLMDKYKQQPVSKPQITTKKVPVPTAQTLAKYKHNRAEEDRYEDSGVEKSPELKEPPETNSKKAKKAAVEAMNYQAILELANKKAQEPVGIVMKPKFSTSKEKEIFEFGRPMTAKEKARFLQEKALKERLLSMNGSLANEKQNIICKPSGAGGKFKIPSLKKKEPPAKVETTEVSKPAKGSTNHSANAGRGVSQNIPPKPSSTQRPQPTPQTSHTDKRPMPSANPKTRPPPPPPPTMKKPSGSQPVPDKFRSMKRPEPPVESKPRISPKSDFPARPQDRTKSLDRPGRPSESRPPVGVRQNVPKLDNRPPPREVDRQRQRSPPRTEVRRPNPAPQQRAPPVKAKRPLPPPYADRPPASRFPVKQNRFRIDSDEDDSEMDDFIDDDEAEIDYSSEIRSIFGYDKRRYVDMDDDDIEESSVTQQWKEEARSAKIGREEDLEDMRLEALEKKQKMMAKKRVKR
ncbi:unnamed protein product [Allacma fusca]|uniref:Protein SPT2 homolog n=1 Tax=Allacma fusca TaxID=39272 RepID=A0A8J2JLT1_9HEXA|nr:unnamed protein product [Allacma fusca]